MSDSMLARAVELITVVQIEKEAGKPDRVPSQESVTIFNDSKSLYEPPPDYKKVTYSWIAKNWFRASYHN